MESENLGPLEAWNIREFPRDLRRQIIDEAKRRQMSPGEFATTVFLAARASGWDAARPVPQETPRAGLLERAQAARALAETAVVLKQAGMPGGLCSPANRALKDTLRPLSQGLLKASRQLRPQPAVITGRDETQEAFEPAIL